MERWFAIKYAIDLTKRIRLKTAIKIMFCGWIYSILMASFPLLGISNYSSTSICLPMEVKSVLDKAYLYSILLINGISLGIIVFCYAQIYFSLGYETRRASQKGEMTIAKKMALLIFIDFATYAPIAFFGMCALVGFPLINITKSKILLVFFYPLNACANPYLYALTTSQYRKDLCLIVSRWGFCKKKAQKYSLTDHNSGGKAPALLGHSEISHCHNCRDNHNGDLASTFL
ncbi:lutropin-choriogonadotropic hormone receptor-like [Cylas formicarius]|uniref:lutropin-choriogonadotropic hormone receptor-like n=1 Tax=Cylas formicarius TaxID=197179 RepID=UPI002958759A|nr:lutropin-choriogonadotropic hormone receptor-like [Cylas formicarius]